MLVPLAQHVRQWRNDHALDEQRDVRDVETIYQVQGDGIRPEG